MDIATFVGLFGGLILVIVAILMGGDLMIFINAPGLLIVAGGSFAVLFIKFTMAEVVNSIQVAMKAFFIKVPEPENIIQQMAAYSKLVRKEGIIALDKEKPEDSFMAQTLRYLADGYEEEFIETLLKKDIQMTVERHTVGQSIFKSLGSSAPAFGMIGTLIGLVQMLSSMSDPKSIGPAMAVALLTTLYGALIANLVCLPIADKLAFRCRQEQIIKNMILEGALLICRGQNPMLLETALKLTLAPKAREKEKAA